MAIKNTYNPTIDSRFIPQKIVDPNLYFGIRNGKIKKNIKQRTKTKSIEANYLPRSAMTWPEVHKQYPKIDPFGDFDKDGIPNYKDCRPLNANMHWTWKGVGSAIASAASSVVKAVTAPTVAAVTTAAKVVAAVTAPKATSASTSASSPKASTSSTSGSSSGSSALGLSVPSNALTQKLGVATPTYNPTTGVSTSSTGVQQSRATVLPGAVIVGGSSQTTRTYTGGSGSPAMSTSSTTTPTSQPFSTTSASTSSLSSILAPPANAITSKLASTGTGSYIAGKGFVTNTGKVYPTTNANWVPSGYTASTPSTSVGLKTSSEGTYDSSTGIYTDSYGNKQSRAVAPPGATIIETTRVAATPFTGAIQPAFIEKTPDEQKTMALEAAQSATTPAEYQKAYIALPSDLKQQMPSPNSPEVTKYFADVALSKAKFQTTIANVDNYARTYQAPITEAMTTGKENTFTKAYKEGLIAAYGTEMGTTIYKEQQTKIQAESGKLGGYWYNPETEDTKSSTKDLSSKGYILTASPIDIKSGALGTPDLTRGGGVIFGEGAKAASMIKLAPLEVKKELGKAKAEAETLGVVKYSTLEEAGKKRPTGIATGISSMATGLIGGAYGILEGGVRQLDDLFFHRGVNEYSFLQNVETIQKRGSQGAAIPKDIVSGVRGVKGKIGDVIIPNKLKEKYLEKDYKERLKSAQRTEKWITPAWENTKAGLKTVYLNVPLIQTLARSTLDISPETAKVISESSLAPSWDVTRYGAKPGQMSFGESLKDTASFGLIPSSWKATFSALKSESAADKKLAGLSASYNLIDKKTTEIKTSAIADEAKRRGISTEKLLAEYNRFEKYGDKAYDPDQKKVVEIPDYISSLQEKITSAQYNYYAGATAELAKSGYGTVTSDGDFTLRPEYKDLGYKTTYQTIDFMGPTGSYADLSTAEKNILTISRGAGSFAETVALWETGGKLAKGAWTGAKAAAPVITSTIGEGVATGVKYAATGARYAGRGIATGAKYVGEGAKVGKILAKGGAKYAKEIAPSIALQSVFVIPMGIERVIEYQKIKVDGSEEEKRAFWATTVGESAAFGTMLAPIMKETLTKPLTRLKPITLKSTTKQTMAEIRAMEKKGVQLSPGTETIITSRWRDYMDRELKKAGLQKSAEKQLPGSERFVIKPIYSSMDEAYNAGLVPKKLTRDTVYGGKIQAARTVKDLQNAEKFFEKIKIKLKEEGYNVKQIEQMTKDYVPTRLVGKTQYGAEGKGFTKAELKLIKTKVGPLELEPKKLLQGAEGSQVNIYKSQPEYKEVLGTNAAVYREENVPYGLRTRGEIDISPTLTAERATIGPTRTVSVSESYKVRKMIEKPKASGEIKRKLYLQELPEKTYKYETPQGESMWITTKRAYKGEKAVEFATPRVVTEKIELTNFISDLERRGMSISKELEKKGIKMVSDDSGSLAGSKYIDMNTGQELNINKMYIRRTGTSIQPTKVSRVGEDLFKGTDEEIRTIKKGMSSYAEEKEVFSLLGRITKSPGQEVLGDTYIKSIIQKPGEKIFVEELVIETNPVASNLRKTIKIKLGTGALSITETGIKIDIKTPFAQRGEGIVYPKGYKAPTKTPPKGPPKPGKPWTPPEAPKAPPKTDTQLKTEKWLKENPNANPLVEADMNKFERDMGLPQTKIVNDRVVYLDSKEAARAEAKYQTSRSEAAIIKSEKPSPTVEFAKAPVQTMAAERGSMSQIQMLSKETVADMNIAQTQISKETMSQTLAPLRTRMISAPTYESTMDQRFITAAPTPMSNTFVISSAFKGPTTASVFDVKTISAPKQAFRSDLLSKTYQTKDIGVFTIKPRVVEGTELQYGVTPQVGFQEGELQYGESLIGQEMAMEDILKSQMREDLQQKLLIREQMKEKISMKEQMKLQMKQEMRQEMMMKQKMKTEQQLKQKMQTKLRPKIKSRLRPRIRKPRIKIPKIRIPKINFPQTLKSSKKGKKDTTRGFDVQIKKRGKFEALGVSLIKEEAMTLGAQRVLGGAAATYQISESGREAESLGLRINPNIQALFRQGKKSGQFVQKERLRIISAGEKREISKVGAEARARGSTTKPFAFGSTKKGGKVKFI
jgi:hypothetical protein